MSGPDRKIVRFPPGLICDVLVFLMSWFLAAPVQRWLDAGVRSFHDNDTTAPPVLGLVLSGAFLLYSLGCWLKRGPLHSRPGNIPHSTGCLFIAWVSLMLSLTLLGATIVMVEAEGDAESGWQMMLLFAVALLPVVFGIRAMAAGDVSRLSSWRKHWSMEVIADLSIIAAILPVTLLWQGGIANVFTQNLAESGWAMRLFAAGMTMVAFAVFYWAPRLVLVWDRITDRWTWLTFAIAATPALRGCFFP